MVGDAWAAGCGVCEARDGQGRGAAAVQGGWYATESYGLLTEVAHGGSRRLLTEVDGGCSLNLRCYSVVTKASNVKLVTVAGCKLGPFTLYFNESIWAAYRESETQW